MNRDIKISGVVAWPSDKDRAGLIENFGLVLRELVQRIGRDTEYELGTVWISERQNFEQPVDVFVNLVNVREHLELVRLLIGAKWRAREIKASLSSVDRKWPAYGWKAAKSTVTIFTGEKIELRPVAELREKEARALNAYWDECDRQSKEEEKEKKVGPSWDDWRQLQDCVQPVVEEPVVEEKPLVSIMRKRFAPRASSAPRVMFTSEVATMTDGPTVVVKDAATTTTDGAVQSTVRMKDAATMTNEDSSRDEMEKEVAVLRLRVAELEVDMSEDWYRQEETRRSLVAIRQQMDSRK